MRTFVKFEQKDSAYNLDIAYVPHLKMLQVFIAGTNTVSIIEHMKNDDGDH